MKRVLLTLLSITLFNSLAMSEDLLPTSLKEKIYPRVYLDLPESTPADIKLTRADSPVEKQLVGDLILFYAFDKGDHFQIISNSDLAELELKKEELHELALKNLRELNLEIKAHQGGSIMMLTAGGDYEATLALLPEVWDSIGNMVEGEILISIPARDILYVTGSKKEGGVEELQKYTNQMIENADKPLSGRIFRWAGSEWLEYQKTGTNKSE
ncbi:conserved hypothetical protein [Coraliomargarita akajimensis DSM 45221]|uniref:DUF1444 family protein n=2 Tax=Coraliomargarita TaxID=442430 RepID=D5ER66_CORAD|nr:conserved hypothetical protein [Coraliomargarita akajimensis DSM 45221]